MAASAHLVARLLLLLVLVLVLVVVVVVVVVVVARKASKLVLQQQGQRQLPALLGIRNVRQLQQQ